jgi:hypothetical protein
MDLCISLIALSCSLCDISDAVPIFLQKQYGSKFQASVIVDANIHVRTQRL